jgi:hypothetical protein
VGGVPDQAPLRTRAGCLIREITVADEDLQELNGITITTELRTVSRAA